MAGDVPITEDGKVCEERDRDACSGGGEGRDEKSRLGKLKSGGKTASENLH